MPQPKRKPPPPPPPAERRLAAVPENPPDPPTLISRKDAMRMLTRLADKAEADGDTDAAAFWREEAAEVAPGYEFEVFLRYRVK